MDNVVGNAVVGNAVGDAVDSKVAVVAMVAMVAMVVLEHLKEDSGTRSEWMVVEDDGNIVVVVTCCCSSRKTRTVAVASGWSHFCYFTMNNSNNSNSKVV